MSSSIIGEASVTDVPRTVYETYRSWKSWDAEQFGVCPRALAAYFAAELQECGQPAAPGLSILEIGFGNGEFASWATAAGCSYLGSERDESLVRLGRAHGFRMYAAEELEESTAGVQCDCIVAFDVLEHLAVDEIAALLRFASDRLVPGGVLIARVPSGDSPFSRSIQYGDVTHRSVIGSGIVGQLARVAGLEVEQIKAPAFPLVGLGLQTFCRRVLVAAVRAVTAYVVNAAFHDNQPRVVTPNLLFVLKKGAAGATKA